MKKYLSLFLVLVLCHSMATITFAAGFTDVSPNDYCYTPVLWAVENGITSGTSSTTFSPSETCTVGQILTFLWRSSGQPKPTAVNPFSDVSDKDYFASAACWAYEHGLVSGTVLNASAPCTRSMVVTYLWKLSGSDAAGAVSFTDVSAGAEYAPAVAWAVEKGITSGTTSTTFSPEQPCTRGQIVTFLYRFNDSPSVTASPETSASNISVLHPDIPDFGTIFGIPVVSTRMDEDGDYYLYSTKGTSVQSPASSNVDAYKKRLISSGFRYFTSKESKVGVMEFYSNDKKLVGIVIIEDDVLIIVGDILERMDSLVPEVDMKNLKYYSQCPNVPDFGAIFGLSPISVSYRPDDFDGSDGWTYIYRGNISEDCIRNYIQVLIFEGFQYVDAATNISGDNFIKVAKNNTAILFGLHLDTIVVAVYNY